MLLSGSAASGGAVMVALTLALPPAGTVTEVALNVTPALPTKNEGVKVFGPVASAGVVVAVKVTSLEPELVSVIVRVAGPAWLSPSDSLPGVAAVVATTALSMRSMPAPWRCTLSRKPRPGLPNHAFGDAVFWRRSRMACEFVLGCASRNSAAAPATCGEDIEVPLRF